MTLEPKFFRKEDNVYDADEFRKVMPVNCNTSFDALSSRVAIAEQDYVRPALGDAMFNKLADIYLRDAGNEEERDAILSVQFAVVHLAFWASFHEIGTEISDMGFRQVDRENALYKYQAERLQRELKQQGFARLGALLSFMAKHIERFEEFRSSKYYTVSAHSLVPDVETFEDYVHMPRYTDNDFCTFRRFRGYITNAEQVYLPASVGRALAKAILENPKADRFAPIYADLGTAVALMAVAKAMPLMGLLPTDSGLKVETEKSSEGHVAAAACSDQVAYFCRHYTSMAAQSMASAVAYIAANQEEFPEWSPSKSSSGNPDHVVFMDKNSSFIKL